MKKKGISLILLVITIIIIIILAGSVILSLVQNSPIENANEAKFKNDVDIFKSELLAYLSEKLLDSNGTFESKLFNSNTETNPIITDVIKSMYGKKNGDTLYTDIFEIKKGELVLKGSVENEKIIEWAEDVGIVEIIKVESTSALWKFDPETRIISGYLGSDLATLTTITIPNYIDGIPVDAIIGNDAEMYSVLGDLSVAPLLTEVIVSDGITTIGDYAFINSENLTNITMPNTLTNIGYMAFQYSGITSIAMGNKVTDIGMYAFQNCSALTNITLPSSLTTIGMYAFQSCSTLSNVTIGNCSIDMFAFESCSALTSVIIGSSILGMFAFQNCSALTSVTIDSGAIGMYAFLDCISLTNVTIGSSAIDMFAFQNCSALTSVTIDSGSIGGFAFQNCIALKNLSIGNGVTNIEEYAFNICTSLETLTLPASITNIGYAVVNNCSSLKNIEVDSSNANYSTLNGILTDKTENIIIQYPPGKTESSYEIPASITGIVSGAFSGCNNITSITIPNNITSIGETAFNGCNNLTSITINKPFDSLTNSPWGATSATLNWTM